MFDLQITDKNAAPEIAQEWATATVSLICTTGIETPSFSKRHKIFVFDDLESEKEECHRPGMQHAPTMKDILDILEFTKTFTDDDKVLIHCYAGLCRSPAIAILTLIQHGATIEEAMDKVIEVRPHAFPNKLIIRLGDVALKQDGALINFVETWRTNEIAGGLK